MQNPLKKIRPTKVKRFLISLEPNMRIGSYGKLSDLEFLCNSFALYLYYTLKEGFQLMKIRK